MKRTFNFNRIISLVLLLVFTVLIAVHIDTIARRQALSNLLYVSRNSPAVMPEETVKSLEERFNTLLETTGMTEDTDFSQRVENLILRLYGLTGDVLTGDRKISDTKFMQEADALFRELVKIDTQMQKEDAEHALSGKDSFTAFAVSLLWDYLDFYEAHFHEEQLPVDGVDIESDVFYTEDNDPLRALDIYKPENAEESLPVIIDIHGGGLMYGDKKKIQQYTSMLAARGYVVVALNYRLCPAVHYEDQIADIMAAYKWVYDHIESYGGDLNNVFLIGDSAGAQLAYYTSLVGQNEELSALYGTELSPLRFRALGLVSGMFDMKSGPNSVLLPCMLGYEYKSCPYYPYLQPEEVLDKGTLPPAFVVTEKKDFLRSASLNFAALLDEKGIEHRLREDTWLLNQSVGHITSVAFPDLPESLRVTDDMLDFFEQYKEK